VTWDERAWECAVVTVSWTLVIAAFALVVGYVAIDAWRGRRTP